MVEIVVMAGVGVARREREKTKHLAGVDGESFVATLPPMRVLGTLRCLSPIHARGLGVFGGVSDIEASPGWALSCDHSRVQGVAHDKATTSPYQEEL